MCRNGPLKYPKSPDLNHPSSLRTSFVASSFFQYPAMFAGLLITISPTSPSGNEFQLESIISISVNGGTTLPQLDGF